MATMTIEQAQAKMFALLATEYMGDRVYEFAQELYQKYIAFIEASWEIEDASDSDSVMWYDDIQEEFFQAVYDRLIKFLKEGE